MQFYSAMKTSTLAISLFAVVCAAVIAVTQVTTKDQIAKNEREQRAKALYEIVPKSTIDNDLLEDTIEVIAPELQGNEQPATVYLARKGGIVKTVILPLVAPDGYSGNIHIIAGINADGSVAGVRVLAHKETPGLGDKVDTKKSDWIFSFDGLSKTSKDDDRWAVKKDGGQFDQFTGATITPRAVVNAVSRGVDYFTENRTVLLQQTNEQTAEVAK
ncbi:electron transport complex, RnfABCDGE type, G subunit [Oceanospirillum sp. MED92]|uniref:Ion-translocating oxidoreductase complex subunit G n=2 Tax=Neptuniibacter caesariensis TaxID=207954 RepID=A0A7U8C9U6_NEPCE|nr:electron transport complex subunit RsxG [Neptuniibacter caesariensis]EAR62434.1 electron transport complex, RnfABCDGE type, G subunit [Oceanospirillum sp. MED92] [Neptuniibacter caesariensis]